jgi:hypothetical protein
MIDKKRVRDLDQACRIQLYFARPFEIWTSMRIDDDICIAPFDDDELYGRVRETLLRWADEVERADR